MRSLPADSEVRVSIVDFDWHGRVAQRLTLDRERTVFALQRLDRRGASDLASGIGMALDEFERDGRPGSSRTIVLFSDGEAESEPSRSAANKARDLGVRIHSVLLGEGAEGAAMLEGLVRQTGGRLLAAQDLTSQLGAVLGAPWAAPTKRVSLRVNSLAAVSADVVGGRFSAMVPLELGENEIVASARGSEGETRETITNVTVTGPIDVRVSSPMNDSLISGGSGMIIVQGSVDAFAYLPAAVARTRHNGELVRVELFLNGDPAVAAEISGERFRAEIQLRTGENRIMVSARTRDHRSAGSWLRVQFRPSD